MSEGIFKVGDRVQVVVPGEYEELLLMGERPQTVTVTQADFIGFAPNTDAPYHEGRFILFQEKKGTTMKRAKRSPNVDEAIFKQLKLLTDMVKSNTTLALATGRGVAVIGRVRRAKDYEEYKQIVAPKPKVAEIVEVPDVTKVVVSTMGPRIVASITQIAVYSQPDGDKIIGLGADNRVYKWTAEGWKDL